MSKRGQLNLPRPTYDKFMGNKSPQDASSSFLDTILEYWETGDPEIKEMYDKRKKVEDKIEKNRIRNIEKNKS